MQDFTSDSPLCVSSGLLVILGLSGSCLWRTPISIPSPLTTTRHFPNLAGWSLTPWLSFGEERQHFETRHLGIPMLVTEKGTIYMRGWGREGGIFLQFPSIRTPTYQSQI